jgi:hypothetical protein
MNRDKIIAKTLEDMRGYDRTYKGGILPAICRIR